MFSISKISLISLCCIFPVLSIVNSSMAFGSVMKTWADPSSLTRAEICEKTIEIAHVRSPPPNLPDTSTSSTPSNGNCTNNLTVQNTITNHPIAADEIENEEAHDVDATTKQPIATFDEWTKEKLKQEQLKASATVPAVILGSGSAPKAEILVSSQSTRNYASKECGAKVITSNAEAENTKALLNDKEKDEYMRNPCSKAENKFVVIELCETIQPRLIELGNFELFSSGPREVKIWGTERFPNSEWELVAELNATDTRLLQTFVLHTRVYSKFIKLELVSHYGNEHYCTLSVLKVLGMSMADEYEIEAQAAVRLPVISEVVQQPNEKTAPVVTEEPKETDKPVINTPEPEITEKVIIESPKTLPQSTFVPMNSSALEVGGKRRLSAFDIHLCRVCPTSPSCIVPTHLCWVFVWRPPPTTKKSKFVSPPLIPEDRSVALRQRRQRYSNLHRLYVEATKGLRSKTNNPGTSNVPHNENIQEQASQQKNKNEKKGIKKAAQDVPAASISAKESVFLKLNKRIAALELNMSLSSEYLSELSRQYVAQADEHHKHIEQAKKAAQDVASDVERRLNQTIVEKVLSMRKEMDSLLASLRVAAFSFAVSPARTQDSYQDTLRNSDYVEEQPDSGSTELKEYYSFADSDGIWTTEQVVYTVVAVQIFTVLALVPILICYINLTRRPSLSEEDLEELIQKKIERTMLEQSDKMKLEKVETESLAQHIREKKKMKRMRQRDRLRQSLNSLDEQRFSDTTISRAASQTETSSEAEIPRSNIRGVVPLCQSAPLRSNA